MTIRTRSELDEALWRVFVEAIADEPTEPIEPRHDAVRPGDATRSDSGEPERELAGRELAGIGR